MSGHGGEIDVGDELPPMPVELDGDAIRAFCAAARLPGARFHSDEGARAEGLPGQIAPGNLSLAWFAALLARALPAARLVRLSGTFRGLVRPGVAMVVRGVVTERHRLADGERLECDLILQTADGDRPVTGTASLRI